MTTLSIYDENAESIGSALTDAEAITRVLDESGIQFERWAADRPVAADASPEDVLHAYREPIGVLKNRILCIYYANIL